MPLISMKNVNLALASLLLCSAVNAKESDFAEKVYVDAVKQVARELAGLTDLTVVVGHPTGGDRRTRSVAVQERHNAASVLRGGEVVATYAKRELPNYQVFDERRYFTPGQGTCVFDAGGVRVGLLICEDAWFDEPARLARDAGAQLLAVINASPFHVGKSGEREQMMRARVAGARKGCSHARSGWARPRARATSARRRGCSPRASTSRPASTSPWATRSCGSPPWWPADSPWW